MINKIVNVKIIVINSKLMAQKDGDLFSLQQIEWAADTSSSSIANFLLVGRTDSHRGSFL